MTDYQFDVLHFSAPNKEPETLTYDKEDYRKAGEKFTLWRIRDFTTDRMGDPDRGFYPYTAMLVRQFDEEGNEVDRQELASNRMEQQQFSRIEPVIEELHEAHNEGKRWFVEHENGERFFYLTEAEALTHKPQFPGEQWMIFNLDNYLDGLEERNLRYFLNHRPALSTNKIESLCGVARGTLSKIKNGQRRLNRKQYERLIPILSYYGYTPHLDLRQLDKYQPEVFVDTIIAEDL